MEVEEKGLETYIRSIPDYPKKGIIFKDITPMLADASAFRRCIDEVSKKAASFKPDYIVGIDARGFIIGSAVAYSIGVGFVPARKKGKLPYNAISEEYMLEYGKASLEMHDDSFPRGSRIVIVDDLLATGGTADAAGKLVSRLGGFVEGYIFVIELSELAGRALLGEEKVVSLLKF